MTCKQKDCIDNLEKHKDFKYGCVAWGNQAPKRCRSYKPDREELLIKMLSLSLSVLFKVPIPEKLIIKQLNKIYKVNK